MKSDIQLFELKNLVDEKRGISYGVVQPGSNVSNGIPIIRVQNINDGKIDTQDIMQIDSEIEKKHSIICVCTFSSLKIKKHALAGVRSRSSSEICTKSREKSVKFQKTSFYKMLFIFNTKFNKTLRKLLERLRIS